MELSKELKDRIAGMVAADEVVLFMKGTRDAPRCGFSAAVVEILNELVPKYRTVDVLSDPEVREGIKAYSDWPTIPQLYVRGELLGGADITREMYQSGELHKKLGVSAPAAPAPGSVVVNITKAAAKVLLEAKKGEPPEHKFLRIAVSARFQHQLGFDAEKPGDVKLESEGVAVVVDAGSAKRANGLKIDAVEQPGGGVAFRIENPNEPASVKQMSARELKQRMDSGAAMEIFDVRTPGERATASIKGTKLLDDAGKAKLDALPKDATIVFHCHHGGRSQAAAERAIAQGFTKVYNLAGGIDSWSKDVDPSVPRY